MRFGQGSEAGEGDPGAEPGSLGPRAKRELAQLQNALDEERAATQRLREEGERLERQRSELEGQVARLGARIHELEATLERDRAEVAGRVTELEQRLKEAGDEHARGHSHREELEQRLATELRSGEELRRELKRAAGAAATQHQRVEHLEPSDSEEASDVDDDGDGPQADGAEESSEEARAKPKRRTWFWRRRTAPPCAVCQMRPPPLTAAELTESGWAVNRAGSLCAACQQDGWRFPAGSAVPFRRMGAPAG
jgi:hypothetical protein